LTETVDRAGGGAEIDATKSAQSGDTTATGAIAGEAAGSTAAAEGPADETAPTPAVVAEAPARAASADPTSAPVLIGYAAEIIAAEEVVVVAEVNGQVLDLLVEVGDEVATGAPLVRLDTTILEAQRAQALAGVKAAQAQLALLRAPVDEENLAAARAAVAAASAGYNRAVSGLTEEEKRQALAQLQQAQAAVSVAQAGYNLVRNLPEVGMLPQGLQLQQATLALEAAQAQYDQISQGATADQIAGAYAQLAGAQAQLARLEEGAKPAQIRAAEAQVRTAENGLYLAQLQVEKATITAPLTGAVARVQTAVGALAAPGVPLLTLISPTVDVTINVEETSLRQLRVGQRAAIRVQAYPDEVFPGVVRIIAPELNTATRTVQVTIRPEDPAGLLRPGLSAQVDLFSE